VYGLIPADGWRSAEMLDYDDKETYVRPVERFTPARNADTRTASKA